MDNSNHSDEGKSDQTTENKLNGRWMREEHSNFLQGLKKFGKNWKRIESVVKSRSGSQIRSHAQKFFNKLERKFQNQQYLNLNEVSESYLINQDEDNAFTQKAIFLREKLQLKASKLKPIRAQQSSHSQSLQQTIHHKPEKLTNPLGPSNCKISCSVFSDIWKYPQQVIKTNFLSTFVDLQVKMKTSQREDRSDNKRKRSFVSCESEELEAADVVRKYQVVGPFKANIRR